MHVDRTTKKMSQLSEYSSELSKCVWTTSSHVMTDDASQNYNAWTAVFEPASSCVTEVPVRQSRPLYGLLPLLKID